MTEPEVDMASCNCQVPPTPLNVTLLGKDLPLLVTVFVPEVAAKMMRKLLIVIALASAKFP